MAIGTLHLTRTDIHYGWSRDHPPSLIVPSGAELVVETQDADTLELDPGTHGWTAIIPGFGRDFQIDAPEFDVTQPLERAGAAAAGYHGAMGVAPDLLVATRQAVERMIAHLTRMYGVDDAQAYALCSVAVDLRISEVVDLPNWVVSALLPKDIFLETSP